MSNEFVPMTQEEVEMIESQFAEAKVKLDAAKIAMLRYRPFYGTLIGTMPSEPSFKWLSTIATDGRSLFYNPEFLVGMMPERQALVFGRIDAMSHLSKDKKDKIKKKIEIFYRPKSVKGLIFLLEHEIRHIICDHMTRGKGYTPDLYNIAADHYINTALVMEHSIATPLGAPWFKGANNKFPEDGEFAFLNYCYMDFKYDSWTAEKIYEDLTKKSSDEQPQGVDQHMGGGTGQRDPKNKKPSSPDDGDTEEKEGSGGDESEADSKEICDALGIDTTEEPRLTKEEKEANAETMKRNIETASNLAGQAAPKDVRELVASFGKAKINYVQLIKRKMVSLLKTKISYRRLSRRSHSITRQLRGTGQLSNSQYVVLPSYNKDEMVDIVIGFDVSGSVTTAMLKRIFTEIKGLTLQYKQFRITLFCWSTEVGNVQVYTKENIRDIDKYKVTTTYGTTVSCVYQFLDAQKMKVDQLIIFTDGMFEDISSRTAWKRKYDTLWIIFDNERFKAPFGKAINFDKYIK